VAEGREETPIPDCRLARADVGTGADTVEGGR
jgi:hypothetical protein